MKLTPRKVLGLFGAINKMTHKKPIGKYLGNGLVELNDNGLDMILEEVKGRMSEKEVLDKVNKKLKFA